MRVESITCLVAFTLLLTACGPSESDFTEFSTYKSPDGSYYVIIDSAHSKLAFGPETIKVYVVEKEKRIRNHIVTTKISNDGAGINSSNVKAKWIQSDVIQFCLSGVEQKDSVLEIDVRTHSHNKVEKKCT